MNATTNVEWRPLAGRSADRLLHRAVAYREAHGTERLTSAELAECECPDLCLRDHDND